MGLTFNCWLGQGGGAQRYEEELKKIYGMDGTMSGTAGGFQVPFVKNNLSGDSEFVCLFCLANDSGRPDSAEGHSLFHSSLLRAAGPSHRYS